MHSGLPEPPTRSNPAQTPTSRRNSTSQANGDKTPRAEATGDSEDEIARSPNTKRVLTRLQHVVSQGASSLVGGLQGEGDTEETPVLLAQNHLGYVRKMEVGR